MNGPDLILKFSNHMNGTELCRTCGRYSLKKIVHVKWLQVFGEILGSRKILQ